MKKIVVFFVIMAVIAPKYITANSLENREKFFNTAFTAGYVFKHDCRFKEVYGKGIVNILTVDGCYYPWHNWGVGAKLSYWRAKGHTNFLDQHTLLQEIPATLYLRATSDLKKKFQIYGSLGAGFIWIKEKSYLGCEKTYKGIGEAEVGLSYKIWHCIDITAAFRYLFPPQSQRCEKADVGGCDLRAGIGFSF